MVLEFLSHQGPAAAKTWCEHISGHLELAHTVFSKTFVVAFLSGVVPPAVVMMAVVLHASHQTKTSTNSAHTLS